MSDISLFTGGLSSIAAGIGAFGAADASRTAAAGSRAAADAYRSGALVADTNEFLTDISGRIQTIASERKVNKIEGTQLAAQGASGFLESGSSTDVLRDTVAQGHLTDQMIGLQTTINENSYIGQAISLRGQALSADAAAKAQEEAASAQETGGIFNIIGGVAKIGALFF